MENKHFFRNREIREYCYNRILKRGHNYETFSELRKSFDRFSQDKIFLSRETLVGYRFQKTPPELYRPNVIDLFKEHFKDYKISVLLIVRRQDTLIESSYLHSDRHNNGLSWNNYVGNRGDLSYSRQAKRWSELGEIYVVPHDQYKTDNEGTLKWLFREAFNQDIDLPSEIPIRNVTLGEKDLLTGEQREEIISEYEEGNRLVFNKYMPRFEYSW